MASLRLAHINLLWSDEDYHLAAAIQLLNGRVPYRDFWYDKPPLAAFFYFLIGGYTGWPLRVLDIAFVLACCWVAYMLARSWWGEAEGRSAALLLAFFTAFYLPPSTIPFAVDGLLLLPQLAAIYFAKDRKPFLSGLCCAAGLLTNVKAVFVVATCVVWLIGELPLFAAGLAAPLVIAGGFGAAFDALPGYYNQVWRWGFSYTKGVASVDSLGMGVKRTIDWLAFHAALLAGIIIVSRESSSESNKAERFKFSVWFVFSAAALVFGNHFAPRYFFQILPVMVIAAARGIVIGVDHYGRPAIALLAILLLIPFVRFGPRYATLALDNLHDRKPNWTDVAMDLDSQEAANFINSHKRPADTLFVWGYRPDIYVYTRLIPPEKFSDSQPLDGVPADRHLQSSQPSLDVATKKNREELIRSEPTFFVDGLGLLNPALRPEAFPDLAKWLQHYQLVQQTNLSRIYLRTIGLSSRSVRSASRLNSDLMRIPSRHPGV